MRPTRTDTRRPACRAVKDARGGALLAVLWLSAALSAIAFSLAGTVRGEIERTATAVDSVRSYYLASGALQRALLYMEWGPGYLQPDGTPRFYQWGMPWLRFDFPTGTAAVQIIPEASKMNVNLAPPEELYRLLLGVGAEPERAREIVLGILDWRSGTPGALTLFDQYYSSLTPSFRARHASLEEIEELLLVKGMTPELFYGTYARDPEGRLVPRGALKDCVTVYGAGTQYDLNTAEPAVLGAIGLPPEVVAMIVEARRRAPFRSLQELGFGPNMPGFGRLRVGGNTIFTLRATARLRLENGGLLDERRSVAATVKFLEPGNPEPYHVLRWYDNEWAR